MVPLISLVTQFLLVALLVMGVMLGVAIGYLYIQARRAESGSSTSLTPRERAELDRRDAEIATIRDRLEDIYQRQQVGSETQHFVVQQQIEQLKEQMKARGRQIEGLQGQLRYEMQQREETMVELRSQLREMVDVFRQSLGQGSHAALPPATSQTAPIEAPKTAPPSAQPTPGPSGSEADTMSEWSWEPVELDFSLNSSEEETVEGIANETVSAAEEEPVAEDADHMLKVEDLLSDDFGTGSNFNPDELVDNTLPAWPEMEAEPAAESFSPLHGEDMQETEFAAVHPGVEEQEEISEEQPSEFQLHAPANEFVAEEADENVEVNDFNVFFGSLSESHDEDDSLASPEEPFAASPEEEDDAFGGLVQWTHLELDADSESDQGDSEAPYAGGDGMATASPAQPEVRPPGADDLTVLPMIDASRQSALYGLGVQSIEEIARWSRPDARRVATAIKGVTENDIMNEWVFAAQSVLFNRYQSELDSRRPNA